jgi:hypothetical protein
MSKTRAILTLAALSALIPAVGQASSPDAWAAFKTDVAAKCLAAAQATGMKSPEVLVHPIGTEAYGIAVLREGADKRICIYGKQSKKVELTPAT